MGGPVVSWSVLWVACLGGLARGRGWAQSQETGLVAGELMGGKGLDGWHVRGLWVAYKCGRIGGH